MEIMAKQGRIDWVDTLDAVQESNND
jgi:hypothetical protein